MSLCYFNLEISVAEFESKCVRSCSGSPPFCLSKAGLLPSLLYCSATASSCRQSNNNDQTGSGHGEVARVSDITRFYEFHKIGHFCIYSKKSLLDIIPIIIYIFVPIVYCCIAFQFSMHT